MCVLEKWAYGTLVCLPSGPPPRYLNVSLAAFGYTGCNRKWGSVQALERDKTATTEQASSSAFLEANVTPQRHKSISPTSYPCTNVQRPYRLDLHDGQDPEVLFISVITGIQTLFFLPSFQLGLYECAYETMAVS